jgi:hypothetical protein
MSEFKQKGEESRTRNQSLPKLPILERETQMVSFTCDHAASDDSTPLTVAVTIDAVDADNDGDIDLRVNLNVVDPDQQADLRGFFFNVSDNDVLSDLMVTGDNVTDQAFDPNGGLTSERRRKSAALGSSRRDRLGGRVSGRYRLDHADHQVAER